jgi:heptosyltransferase-2
MKFSLPDSPRILIIRFSSIGDILMTTPVIRAIRKKFPDANIHYLTKAKFKEAIEQHPDLNKVWLLEGKLAPILQELKEQSFDLILDLHDSIRSRLVRFQLGVPFRVYPKKAFQRWKYTKLKWGLPDPRHTVQKYLSTLQDWGIMDDGLGLDFPIRPEVLLNVKEKIQDLGLLEGKYLAIALGGSHETKKWPTDYYIRLLNSYPHKVVLLGGSAEILAGRAIQEACGQVINLTGKTTLEESGAWLKLSLGVVTHDTGLMHISAALQQKVLVIWGNTSPELGMYPWRTPHYNFENPSLSCRPCSHLGYTQCPKGHFLCMKTLTPEKLLYLLENELPFLSE